MLPPPATGHVTRQERRLAIIVPQPRQCLRFPSGSIVYCRLAETGRCSLGVGSDMKATIYHNPMCGTSRKTLEILRDSGCDVWVREYLKSPPSRDELKRLYRAAGISPRDGLRSKEPLADELGLNRPEVTDDELLDAMT